MVPSQLSAEEQAYSAQQGLFVSAVQSIIILTRRALTGFAWCTTSFWICRDFESSEWFKSLLHAIEEQDLEQFIEIAVFMTSPVQVDDLNNIVLQE
jgi:hypothetical protein